MFTQFIGRELKNRSPVATQVLLIFQALIGRNKQIELVLGERQEFAVLQALPAHLLRGSTRVISEQLVQRPRQALIKQDIHTG